MNEFFFKTDDAILYSMVLFIGLFVLYGIYVMVRGFHVHRVNKNVMYLYDAIDMNREDIIKARDYLAKVEHLANPEYIRMAYFFIKTREHLINKEEQKD